MKKNIYHRESIHDFPLTGQGLVSTMISPEESIYSLATRQSLTTDLAGNHDFA